MHKLELGRRAALPGGTFAALHHRETAHRRTGRRDADARRTSAPFLPHAAVFPVYAKTIPGDNNLLLLVGTPVSAGKSSILTVGVVLWVMPDAPRPAHARAPFAEVVPSQERNHQGETRDLSVNKEILVGNLDADPELTTEHYKNKASGEFKEMDFAAVWPRSSRSTSRRVRRCISKAASACASNRRKTAPTGGRASRSS